MPKPKCVSRREHPLFTNPHGEVLLTRANKLKPKELEFAPIGGAATSLVLRGICEARGRLEPKKLDFDTRLPASPAVSPR